MVTLALVAGAGYFVQQGSIDGGGPTLPGGIALVRPAIAQQTGTFLDQEAGMSAYVDVGAAIDLNNARNAFRIVEQETAEWLIGSVPVPGYPEAEDAHVFVHQSGWIVSYYERGSPVGRTVHWNSHPILGSHKLVQALNQVANSAGISVARNSFFNFEFPNATEWLLIIDDDNFSVNIPGQFTLFERSFSHYTTVTGDPCNSAGSSNLKVDSVSLSVTCAAGIRYGPVSAFVLSQEATHQVSILDTSGPTDDIQGSAAISLLYLPPP